MSINSITHGAPSFSFTGIGGSYRLMHTHNDLNGTPRVIEEIRHRGHFSEYLQDLIKDVKDCIQKLELLTQSMDSGSVKAELLIELAKDRVTLQTLQNALPQKPKTAGGFSCAIL